MYDGYNRIFWGIFITRFHINLGPIRILPAFAGFLLIVSGLDSLYVESSLDGYNKAKSMGKILVALSLIGGVIEFITQFGMNYSFVNIIWTIGFIIIEFIFYFKIMESSVEYLNLYNYDELREAYILKLRKYTIFSILNIFILSINLIFNFQSYLKITLYIGVFLSIYLMTMVHGLRNIFKNHDLQEGIS